MTRQASRREFLRHAGAMSMLGAAAPLGLNLAALGTAAAQTAPDYKAIVCLFLFGGNDAYNMVVPTEATQFANYTTVRNQAPDSIALLAPGTAANAGAAAGSPARLGGVLALNGVPYALHPTMSGVQAVFNQGRLAILPNIGPLLRPTTKAQYRAAAHPKPANLFSHNDQQSTWQSLQAEGATTGWGGRMGDLLASSNGNALFTSISSAGNAVWLAGRNVLQYQVTSNGAIRIGGGNTLFGSQTALARMRTVMRTPRTGDLLARDHAAIVGRSMDAEALVSASLPPASAQPFRLDGLTTGTNPLLQYVNPVTGATATNGLAQQFEVVGRIMGARTGLQTRRQVFFVSLGGFDTHDNQNRTQADLMARLSHGLAYFDALLERQGLRNNVTLFTASDFGRTFTSNGDGTDHGWGSHHFVMGGAVRGGALYGSFPQLGLPATQNDFTSPDQIANGAMLPSTSVDQLGATLGRWFGLTDAQLLELFPNLSQFDASVRNLGFMA